MAHREFAVTGHRSAGGRTCAADHHRPPSDTHPPHVLVCSGSVAGPGSALEVV